MEQTPTAAHAPLTVKITPCDKHSPDGKLADAEVHFHTGPLTGMRLMGFAVWARRTGTGRNVTYPARIYSVHGEKRSFSLLRPFAELSSASEGISDLVLAAYAETEGGR